MLGARHRLHNERKTWIKRIPARLLWCSTCSTYQAANSMHHRSFKAYLMDLRSGVWCYCSLRSDQCDFSPFPLHASPIPVAGLVHAPCIFRRGYRSEPLLPGVIHLSAGGRWQWMHAARVGSCLALILPIPPIHGDGGDDRVQGRQMPRFRRPKL